MNRCIRSFAQAASKKFVVTRQINKDAIATLQRYADSNNTKLQLWASEEPMPRSELLQQIEGASGVLCMLSDKIDAELLQKAGPQLKVVSTMSVGYDHIDAKLCKERSIAIGYTPDVLTETTAELAVSLALAAARRLPEGMEAVKNGGWTTWKPEWLLGQDITGSVVGIVGLGRIGAAFARRIASFRPARILYTGPRPKPDIAGSTMEYVDFETLVKESDFISLHNRYEPSLANLFNAETFAKMKLNAILINTSRGQCVDQDALYDALKNNVITAAALDVTVPEPLPTNHKLLTLPNCIVLPHIGSATVKTRKTMAHIAVENLIAGAEGRKLHSQVE